MDVYIEKEDRKLKVDFEGKVIDLLLKIKVNPETVIVVKDDGIVVDEDILKKDDDVKILSIISGG